MSNLQQSLANIIETNPQESFALTFNAWYSMTPVTILTAPSIWGHDTFAWICTECADPKFIPKTAKFVDLCPLGSYGGIIITGDSDLNVALILPSDNIPTDILPFYHDVLDTLAAYITEKFSISVWRDNNDILTKDGKFCATTIGHRRNIIRMFFSISLTDHIEVIEKIGLPYQEGKKPTYIDVDKLTLLEVWKSAITDVCTRWGL